MNYKQLFKEHCLNQTYYANLLNVSKGYFSDMLSGRRVFKKESELRTHLRNTATSINNFLEK